MTRRAPTIDLTRAIGPQLIEDVPEASDFARRLVAATPELRRTIWSLLRGQATADRVDDLTQETLLRAWKYQHTFDGTNLSGWLYCIARNWHISQARRHQTKTLSVPQFTEQLPDPRRTDERLEVAQALRLAKRLRQQTERFSTDSCGDIR